MSFWFGSYLMQLQLIRWVRSPCRFRVISQLPLNFQWSGEGPVLGQAKVQNFVT